MNSVDRVGVPMRGVRLVSLADEVLPALTKAFVDLGADVEVVRHRGTTAPASPVRALLDARGKRLTVLGGAPAEMRSLITGRLAEADALVVTPDAARAVGFDDHEEIAAEHPHLVIAVLTDFGLAGERAQWRGTDAVFQALSGSLSRSGEPGRPPLLPPGDLFTHNAAHEIAWTLLATLYRSMRGAKRRGALLDCSIFDAGAACFDPAYGMTGSGTPESVGTHGRPDAARVYPIFEVVDGFIRLCVLAKGQWLALRAWMGDPEPLLREEFLTNPGRWEHADVIVPAVAEFLAGMTCDQVVTECRERRIPAARVLTLGEVLEEEHYRVNGVFTKVGELNGTPVVVPEGMSRIDGRRSVPLQAAPQVPQPRATWPVEPADPGPFPLSGLRVLDIGVIVAGATVGQLFAQLGARVIRIENTSFPDGMRRSFDWSTPSQARGHRGKESVGLDLRTDEGRRIFQELVRSADIVTSNFKPGTVEKLGISYADLAAVNPRVVCVESSAFGDSGPWRTAMGYGPLVRAASGLTWLWRERPESTYFADGITVYPDHLIGRICAFTALACSLDARRNGRGAHVRVAQSDVGLIVLDEHLAAEGLAPGSVLPPGYLDPRPLDAVIFQAAGDDQWCVIDPETPDQVAAVRRTVGATEADDLSAAVVAYVRDRDADEVGSTLQAAGVPAARMLRLHELPGDRGLQSRDWYHSTQVAGTDENVLVERCSVVSSDLVLPELAPMPMFGAHTRSVLAEVGLGPEEIEGLVVAGVAQEHRSVRDR